MQYAHYRTQTVVHTKFKNFQRTDLRPCPSYTVTEHTVANGFRKHCFKDNIENYVSYSTTSAEAPPSPRTSPATRTRRAPRRHQGRAALRGRMSLLTKVRRGVRRQGHRILCHVTWRKSSSLVILQRDQKAGAPYLQPRARGAKKLP